MIWLEAPVSNNRVGCNVVGHAVVTFATGSGVGLAVIEMLFSRRNLDSLRHSFVG